MAQGIDKIPIRWPAQYDPAFMERLFRDVLAKADIRNAVAGPGINIEGQPDEPATVSSSEDLTQLLEQTFVLALPSGFLQDERILQGEQDIIDIIDEGPGGDIIVALVDGGVPLYKLNAIPALSVLLNPTAGAIPPFPLEADADGKFLVRRSSALTFDTLADADIPAGIARDSEVAAAITAHEGAANPHPTYLTQAEGDALYQPLAAVLSMLHAGTGTPEGALAAPVGHLYLRTDGGASTTLYVKESGAGNTGWVAK